LKIVELLGGGSVDAVRLRRNHHAIS